MRIALTGNPNSGKTTMFNALTGRNEKIGNWAGVTVEKKEHLIKKVFTGDKNENIIAVDLPGAYSLSPFTSEEGITSAFLKKENPDVIINIVDASNLSRSLFFTSQLLELGIPIVVALNKSDVNLKNETEIDIDLLSKKLCCPVVKTVSTENFGLRELVEKAISVCEKGQVAPFVADESVETADKKRYEFVKKIVLLVEKRKILTKNKNFSDKIDKILTNKFCGILFFAIVMFFVFQISQNWIGTPIADLLVSFIEKFQNWVGELFSETNPLLQALLVDGIIGGVGAVVGFLPLVMVMYFLIALLEDCGYMSRVSVVLDPIFKKVGLSGKAVISFVIGTGCAIPGIMASRTIRNENERRATAMLTPFMPCGAKIPVIALIAGAFFDNKGWVSTIMYLSGILIIFVGAFIIKKITCVNNKKSYFIIELPEYKIPSVLNAVKSMCARGWAYIVKASTIILLCNTVVQVMQSFDWQFKITEIASNSILASVATPFAYVLLPIVGVLSWQLAAASVTGFIAKENIVGTLAVCFVGLENFINIEDLELLEGAGGEVAGIIAITKVAALAYLMFNLFTPPCFAAIGAMNAEMKSLKWVWAGIGLQCGVGYTVGYFVYTFGTLFTSPKSLNLASCLGGFLIVVTFVVTILCLIKKTNKKG